MHRALRIRRVHRMHRALRIRRVHSMHRSSTACHLRTIFQHSSAGPDFLSSMLLPRPAFHRLKPGRQGIAYPNYFSTFISRIGRSRQYAAAEAGTPPAEAGTPGYCISGLFSTFISRIRRSRQDAAFRAGIPPYVNVYAPGYAPAGCPIQTADTSAGPAAPGSPGRRWV